MNLYFLRHAIAAEPGTAGITNDRERPLTDEGRAKTRKTAAGLRRAGASFDLILSSPCLRAKETADIVAAALRAKRALRLSEHLAPGGSLRGLVAELTRAHAHCEEVLLVGHEPDFSAHISRLVTGGPGLQLEMKKGGLCKLAVDSLKDGRCATLQWLLPPKLLTRLK